MNLLLDPESRFVGSPTAAYEPELRPTLGRIRAVSSSMPRHYYAQDVLLDACKKLWGNEVRNKGRLEQLHHSVLVEGRHLALSLEETAAISNFTEANEAYIRCAVDLGARAVSSALDRAGMTPKEVDHIFSVSITGIAAPSVEARIANRLGFRPDVKRTPIFGLGCVAGAAGVARATDYVKAYPDETAVLLSVELCSLTLQRSDLSVRNFIASGLFGDGAAAVVVGGRHTRGTGPAIVATRSVLYPDTEDVMGWDVTADGFRVVLSADVPAVVREHIRSDVDRFLADHGLTLSQIDSWVCHPGGPKVLLALQDSLGVSREALSVTWDSLRRIGNVSSASVLVVLEETVRTRRPRPGSYGMMIGMGPGFCAELVLLRW